MNMSWFKQHKDMITIVSSVVGSVVWITTSIHNVEKRTDEKFSALTKNIDERFVKIEKDIAIIKTVLILKEVMPKEMHVTAQTKQMVAKG
jgi:hypothetical protein